MTDDISGWADFLLEEEKPPAIPVTRTVPVGYRTRIFLERGAPIGVQRIEAVRAARNLLGAGYDVEVVAAKIWDALEVSPYDPERGPWTWDEVYRMVADVASKPAPPLPPWETGTLIVDTGHTAVPLGDVEHAETDTGTFTFWFAAYDTVLEISQVVATPRGTTGWVRALIGGAEVAAAECELRTAQGVLVMHRFFEVFQGDKTVPWVAMLEHARRHVIRARRTGGTPVRMSAIKVPERPRLRVSPLIVNGELNVIFGMGGCGKSLLMQLLASLIQEGRSHAGLTVEPGNVLYLDWEQGGEDARETLDALARGIGGHGNYLYMRCTGTLVEMAEEIGRIIHEQDIDVVMIDSLTFALAGDKNDAQTVTAGTNAMRLWREGTTVIALDHQAKQQGRQKPEGPFGSVFVRNAARNMLQIDAYMDADAHILHQVIEQRKTNKGMLPKIGLAYVFEPESFAPERIRVELEEPPFDIATKRKLDMEQEYGALG